MPPKALITGATGFIGNHFVQSLKARNWEVTCLTRPESKTGFLKRSQVRIIKDRIENHGTLEKAVTGQDYVFHLAARIHSTSRKIYDQANHQFTRNLANACVRKNPAVKRFVYISSISAGGPSPPGGVSDENRPPAPSSEYGRSKLRGENAVQEVSEIIPTTIIRPPNVYGPRQKETELLIKLTKKRIVPVLKDRGGTTSLIFVKDLNEGIIQAAISSKTINKTYYLTDGKVYSWRRIIMAIKRSVLGDSLYLPIHENTIYFFACFTDMLKKAKIVKSYFGRRAWRAMIQTPWLFSPAKAEKDFGFSTRFSLEEGIEETVRYYDPK